MNVLIIGGVAAGTKTAAKLKRMAPDARVTLLAKDKDISYAGCPTMWAGPSPAGTSSS